GSSIRRGRSSTPTCIRRCSRCPTRACPAGRSCRSCRPATRSGTACCVPPWWASRRVVLRPRPRTRTTRPRARSIPRLDLSARLRPVADGAEFGECLAPGVGACDPDEAYEGAVAEADPLHELHRGVRLRILRLRLYLVRLQVVEPQHVAADDA